MGRYSLRFLPKSGTKMTYDYLEELDHFKLPENHRIGLSKLKLRMLKASTIIMTKPLIIN